VTFLAYRDFNKEPGLPLSVILGVSALSFIGIVSSDPWRWVKYIFVGMYAIYLLTALGVGFGIIFIPGTYGFLTGGVGGAIAGVIFALALQIYSMSKVINPGAKSSKD